MRLSPKTFSIALLCLGMAAATGWFLRNAGNDAFDAGAEADGAQVTAADSSEAARSPATPGAGTVPGVPAGGAISSVGAAAGAVSMAPRIALRPPAAPPAAGEEWRGTLAPRASLPKGVLVSPPGQVHQLTVKLSDHLEARPQATGELLVTAARPEDVAGLARVAEAWRLSFRPVQTVGEDSLRNLQDRAARLSGRAQPDLGGIVQAVLPDATPERVLAAASALQALAEVEFAEIHSIDAPPPPPGDISPPTPSLTSYQSYRQAATGVDIDFVWNTYGIRGAAGLKVTDCEYQYRPTHEDLAGFVTLQSGIQSMYTAFGDDHGTAVLGILAAGDNGYGMTGSIPLCQVRFYPEYSTPNGGGFQDRTATVTAAIAGSAAGDVVMLEMQDTGANGSYGPAEYMASVWTAVKAGTDAGVIVVAAAGNGAENLDSAVYQSYRNRGDSGAILVGAGSTTRARQSFSTYGARVNLQGWGGGVATTGYGSLQTYGGDANQKYANAFSGTSSATPIVTSAVALLQSAAIEILERRLSPAEMRNLLVTTGRAQTGDLSKLIGPLPDLAAAVQALFAAQPPKLSSLRSWGFHELGTGTPDLHADPDGDGLENILEYLLGTNPKDGSDLAQHPQLSLAPGPPNPGEGRTLRFAFTNPTSRTAASWVVESSSGLGPAAWQPVVHGVGGVTISRSGDTVYVEIAESASDPQRFLRLRATIP